MSILKDSTENDRKFIMRSFKYLIGFWTAVVVYTFFSVLSGPKGISAYNQLLYERDQQLANIKELKQINEEELEKKKNNLLFDYDTKLVYARQINYSHEDDRHISIVGLRSIKNTPMMAGKAYVIKEPDFISDKTIKIISICAGFLIFAFIFTLELIESRVR